jgi:predicted double-glycine peptidase
MNLERVIQNFLKQVLEVSIDAFPHRINFPSLRQSYTYSCGSLACQTILIYYGFDIREGTLINEMDVDESGVNPSAIRKALEKRGLKVTVQINQTIEDLKKYIDQKIPVIVDVQAYPRKQKEGWEDDVKNSHYAVVIGYSDTAILFSDPADVNYSYLANEAFMRRWHGLEENGDSCRGWVMVPHGLSPVYDCDRVIQMK